MAFISQNAPADSFSFIFKNTSNAKKSIELFQLGLENNFTPQPTYYGDLPFGTPSAWTGDFNALASFFQATSEDATTDEDNIWVTQSVTTRLAVQDGAGNIAFVDLPTTYSGTFADFNAELQNLIDTMITSTFLSAGTKVSFTLRPFYWGGSAWKGEAYGLSLTKPESSGSGTKIDEIWIEQSGLKVASFNSFDTEYDAVEVLVEMANDVIIDSGGGVPYPEIERSQNGAFLDMRGIGVQVLSSSPNTIEVQNAQCLQSLGFVKLNPTGDDYLQYYNPTISPYQTQNVVNDIDMDDRNGLYVLDGNTRFDYDIDAWINVELTFDYVQFPNFILKYGWKVADAVIDLRQAEQDLINSANAIRRNVELDIKEKDVDKVQRMLRYAKGERK